MNRYGLEYRYNIATWSGSEDKRKKPKMFMDWQFIIIHPHAGAVRVRGHGLIFTLVSLIAIVLYPVHASLFLPLFTAVIFFPRFLRLRFHFFIHYILTIYTCKNILKIQ